MNSVKTAFVSLMLLGVLYGMYQVLSTPSPQFDEDGRFVAETPVIEDGSPVSGFDEISPEEAINTSFHAGTGGDAGMAQVAPNVIRPGSSETGSGLSAGGSFTDNPREASGDSASPNPVRDVRGGSSFVPPRESTVPGTSAPAETNPTDSSALGGGPEARFTGDRLTTTEPPPASSFVRPNSSVTPEQGDAARTAPGPVAPMNGPAEPAWPAARTSRNIADADFQQRLVAAWTLVDSLVDQGKFKEALQELTFFYDHPRLSNEEAATLVAWLDGLAAKVIYSTEHLWDEAYVVRQGDTLESIATAFGVSKELLFNINNQKLSGHTGPLMPGLELKVITGPFRLRIEQDKQRLTLFVDNCYAGRFELVESAGLAASDDLFVKARYQQAMPIDAGTTGELAMAGDQLGPYALQLSDGTVIQQAGTGVGAIPQRIGVSEGDAWDLFSILAPGCRVSVKP